MPTHNITISDAIWPEGVTVGLYPVSNWPTPIQQREPSGAPVGSATATAVVTSGNAVFTAITDGNYWAVGPSPYRYKQVTVGPFTGGSGDLAHTGGDNSFSGANSFSQNVTVGPYITMNATTGGITNTGWTLDGSGGLTLASKLLLAAGSTSIPPFQFTAGPVLTSPLAGGREYDGKSFYSTPNVSNRGVDQTAHLISQTGDFTGTNDNAAHPIFNASAAGTITLPAATSYLMVGRFHIHTTGATSHQLGLLFGGTATLTSIGYQAAVTNAATEVTGAPSTIWVTVATVTNVTPATATATHHSVQLDGIVRVNGAGTFIPQYQWSAAPGAAGVTLANSYFMLIPIGSNTATTVGNWS